MLSQRTRTSYFLNFSDTLLKNSDEVISLLLEQQEKSLKEEIRENTDILHKLEELKTSVIYPYNTSFCHYRKLLCRTVYLVRCFLLNSAAGIVSGYFYRKYGIQYAMLSHALLHIISRTICLVAIP